MMIPIKVMTKKIAMGLMVSAGCCLLAAPMAQAKQPTWKIDWAQGVGKQLVKELAAACPPAAPSDEAALKKCRTATFKSGFLNEHLRDFILWGGGAPNGRVEDHRLTQFGEKLFRGLYLPLFMFSGKVTTEYKPDLNRLLVRAETRFRGKLKPGQYAYPFWHEASKWNAYLKANELVFTIDMWKLKVIAIQRSPHGGTNAKWVVPAAAAPREFKKDEWMWRDANGNQQPEVTLFHGLYSSKNPHLQKLDASYRDFALQLRDQTCFVCHVPNNPEKMQHLVLLQTPAHAAAEINRVIRAVKSGAMPVKSWAGPQSIKDSKAKAKFLAAAEQFKTEADAAAAWEGQHGSALKNGVSK